MHPRAQDIAAAIFSNDVTILFRNLTANAHLTGHTDTVIGVQYASQGLVLASFAFDGSLIVRNANQPWTIIQSLKGHTQAVSEVDFNKDNSLIVSVATDATAKLWSVTTGLLYSWPLMASGTAALFSKYQTLALAGDQNGNIVGFNTTTGKQSFFLSLAHSYYVSGLSESVDGKYFVSSGYDHKVKLWFANNSTISTVIDLSKPAPGASILGYFCIQS